MGNSKTVSVFCAITGCFSIHNFIKPKCQLRAAEKYAFWWSGRDFRIKFLEGKKGGWFLWSYEFWFFLPMFVSEGMNANQSV